MMPRTLSIGRVVMVYLLLGFFTTWAVAWGLALLPPGNQYMVSTVPIKMSWGGTGSLWSYHAIGVGRSRVPFVAQESDYELSWLTSAVSPSDPFDGSGFLLAYLDVAGFHSWGMRRVAQEKGQGHGWDPGADDARGFPALAAWCSWPLNRSGIQIYEKQRLKGGIAIADLPAVGNRPGPIPRALPYYPIWSGLALNTAFYALLFFVVVRICRAFKHARRFQRGLCPRCGYDLLGSFTGPCPECGHIACKRKNHAAASA